MSLILFQYLIQYSLMNRSVPCFTQLNKAKKRFQDARTDQKHLFQNTYVSLNISKDFDQFSQKLLITQFPQNLLTFDQFLQKLLMSYLKSLFYQAVWYRQYYFFFLFVFYLLFSTLITFMCVFYVCLFSQLRDDGCRSRKSSGSQNFQGFEGFKNCRHCAW